eukprot:3453970-Rhodomonas_salina.1
MQGTELAYAAVGSSTMQGTDIAYAVEETLQRLLSHHQLPLSTLPPYLPPTSTPDPATIRLPPDFQRKERVKEGGCVFVTGGTGFIGRVSCYQVCGTRASGAGGEGSSALRACYAVSGTDAGYGATRSRVWYEEGARKRLGSVFPIALSFCYAMPGTGIERQLCDVPY